MAKAADEGVTLEIDAHSVSITHPERVVFPTARLTKLDLVQYYVNVGEAVMRGDELTAVDPSELTVLSVPDRLERLGDPLQHMREQAGSLDGLLAWSERDEAAGLGDAPWPPHYRKIAGEPIRAAPSRRRKT